jgi:hypothetical protein
VKGSRDLVRESIQRRKERIPPDISSSRWRRQLSFSSCHRYQWFHRSPSNGPISQTCSLLAKLPLVIRLQIYTCVLGGSTLHIIELKQRLAHINCPHYGVLDVERVCFPHGNQRATHPIWSDDQWEADWQYDGLFCRRLALLQTCRQVYIEAIDILYTTNTFDFSTAESFNFFARSILSKRLATTRSLSVGLFMTDDVPQFTQVTPQLQSSTRLGPYVAHCQKKNAWPETSLRSSIWTLYR